MISMMRSIVKMSQTGANFRRYYYYCINKRLPTHSDPCCFMRRTTFITTVAFLCPLHWLVSIITRFAQMKKSTKV